MKASMIFVPVLGFLSTLSICAQGQTPPTGQSGSGVDLGTCDNPPCATVSCGGKPCPQDGRPATIGTGRPAHPIPPMTPERKAKIEEEMRYGGLFAGLEADEQLAQRLEAEGDAVNAASWRADFARKSGLTPEEAETVKKIAAQYRKDQVTLNAQCRADVNAARDAHLGAPGGGTTWPDIVSCDQLRTLFPKVMADLLSALGSRSFTRLDGYTRHMLDNAKPLGPQGPGSSQQGSVPNTPGGKEMPQ